MILHGQHLRLFQIESVYSLFHLKKNTLLVRKTGEGKSAVFYAACCLFGKVVLSITPLIGLSAQQCQQIEFLEEYGVYSFHLDTLGSAEADKFCTYLLSLKSVEDYDAKHKCSFVLFASPSMLVKGTKWHNGQSTYMGGSVDNLESIK